MRKMRKKDMEYLLKEIAKEMGYKITHWNNDYWLERQGDGSGIAQKVDRLYEHFNLIFKKTSPTWGVKEVWSGKKTK